MAHPSQASTKLTIDEIVKQLESDHRQGLLNLARVSSLLKCLIYDQELRDRIFATPIEESPPTHRCVFWKSADEASLEGFGWAPQAATHIHSHDHEGLALHLEGQLEEIHFTWDSSSGLKCTRRCFLDSTSVLAIPKGNACIHIVANTSDREAIDIHYYSPKCHNVTPLRFDPKNPIDINQVQPGDVILASSRPDPAQL